jgi:UDP-N-acetylglucosamine 4,6-dehydratase/5-epimerase
MNKNIFKNKVILVTGGVGSIGSALIKELIKHQPKQIRIFDNRETELVDMQRSLLKHENLSFLVGDVRDKERLNLAMRKVDIIFHAAALKHVPACEYNPFEAVKTNVGGTQNIIDTALENNVERVINISTDKVTNTINTMGATKLLAERLISSAHYFKGDKKTLFTSVRFGNVLNSRGSILELLDKQIKNKNPVTITEPEMTRFIMSIPEAVRLVIKAANLTQGGDVFILKMPVFKLKNFIDVAIDIISSRYKINKQRIKIKKIGLRAGEKMHEDLMTEEESKSVIETENYLILSPKVEIPLFKKAKRVYKNSKKTSRISYSSKNITPLTNEQINKLLSIKQVTS